MRLNLLLLAIVVLLGLGISILLVPRDKDVALLKLRSDEADEARLVLLEQYDAGDRSVQVIASLASIAILDGEVPTAIQLLENYVAANPKDASGLRQLAEYYRYDQRREDYVRTLAMAVRLAGTDQERRTLVDLYRVRGDYPALLAGLDDLIARNLASHTEFLEAIELAAAQSRFEQSLAYSRQMWRAYDWSFDTRSVRLFVMVAAADGKLDEAKEVVARLAKGERGPAAIVPVIRQISDRNQPELGLALLSQFEGKLHHTPPLLVAWARMQAAMNREAVALDRLLELERAGTLPELVFPVLLDLALVASDINLVDRLLEKRNMSELTDFRLRAVGDQVVFHRHRRLLLQLLEQAPARFRRQHPALMAEVHFGLGHQDAARAEAVAARTLTQPRIQQLLRLARVEFKLGQEERAAATLQRIATHPGIDAASIRALASLYIQTDRTRDGLEAFARLRREQPSFLAEAGWVRMAAGEGREQDVLAWLEKEQAADRDLLSDIVFLSISGGSPRAALTAAQHLVRDYPDGDSNRLLADALIANARHAEAIPILEALLPGTDEDAESYVGALYAADRKAEAFAFLQARADGRPLASRLADDYIGLALELGQPDLAYAAARQHDPARFGDDVIAALIESAAGDGEAVLVEEVISRLGQGFMANRPVMAARIELARGNHGAALDWARQALADDRRSKQDSLRLATIFSTLGEKETSVSLLEALAADPTTPAFAIESLATQYLELGREKQGLEVFRDLIKRRQEARVLEGWARLEAAAGDPRKVLQWLRTVQDPSRQVLLDLFYGADARRQNVLAFEAAQRLYKTYPGREANRVYAAALIGNGRYGDAIPILENLLPGNDEEAQTYVAALSAADRRNDALQFLLKRGGGEALPIILADDLMALAIELDQPKIAYAEARRHNMRVFDEDTIASLVENAAEDGDFDLVDRVVAQVGPGFMEARPTMSARIELARGNEKQAKTWAAKALARKDRRNAETLILAKVFNDLGEIDTSLALLELLTADPTTPAYAMADLAQQYLTLGKEKQGLPVFHDLIRQRQEPQVLEGWARLETRAGQPDKVLAWLKSADTATRQGLLDIYYLSDARKADALSFATAEQLKQRYPGDESSLIWGRALTQAGRGAEALAVLKPLLPGGPAVRAAYVAALGKGGETTDLRSFAEAALKDPDLDPEVRSAILFALLDKGAGDLALPELRRLAKADPKQWETAYQDALRQAGATDERVALIVRDLKAGPKRKRRDELLFELLDVGGPARALPWLARVAQAEPESTWPATYETALAELGRQKELVVWLSARSLNPALSASRRREAAFRLLDLEARQEAEAAFLSLATTEGPKSDNVQQLMFLWGPRPPQHGIDWLVGRAQTARPQDRGGWLSLLADVRAFDAVIALGYDPVPSQAADPVLAPLSRALIDRKHRDELGALLGSVIPTTDDPKVLLQIADWAEQGGAVGTAVDAYRRALQFIGEDPEALLKAGRSFAFASRPELAKDVLERYFSVQPKDKVDDHRPWYYYAVALSQMNRQPEAREAYRQMLTRLDRNKAEDFESRRMRAAAYEAIGDGDRAIEIYEQLLAERPRDRSLRADFAALLIELRRYERAELLLGQN